VSDETALVPIPPEHEAAWARVEGSSLNDQMKAALRLVACGEQYREAARLVGYADHSRVYATARKFDLVDLRTQTVIKIDRSISKLAGAELERRLTEKIETITAPQLAVIKGISTDKVLAHDKSAKDDGTSYMSALEEVAARVAESGAQLELKVTVKPADPQKVTLEAETIDVTPP